jgi:hypothetical protein
LGTEKKFWSFRNENVFVEIKFSVDELNISLIQKRKNWKIYPKGFHSSAKSNKMRTVGSYETLEDKIRTSAPHTEYGMSRKRGII